MKVTNKHHVLETPLVVYRSGPDYQTGILPIGTSLRYVESFPEGFDRFVVTVNVERSPLPLQEMIPPGLVDPLSAMPGEQAQSEHPLITTEELRKLLRNLRVKRDDLFRLLESYE